MNGKTTTVDISQFNNSLFFRVSLKCWPARAKVKDTEGLRQYLDALNAENGAVTAVAVEGAPTRAASVTASNATKTTKELIKSEAYDKIRQHLAEIKARLCGPFGMANPSRVMDGLFAISKNKVADAEAILNAGNDKLTLELIPAFLGDYEAAKERKRTLPVKQGGLGPIYCATDYPPESELESMFGLDWQWLALGVPDDLPLALRQEANAKFQRQMEDAADEVKQALRASLGSFVDHLVERLQPSEDGKPKVFRDTLIGNVAQFCEVFDSRNIMNDGELATLVSRAKTLIEGVTPDKLRQYSAVKDNTLAGFQEIKAQLDTMITERKSRKFNLDEA